MRRAYSIFAFEYFGAARFGAAVAVAVTMAPVLMIFIFLLGKYMSNSGRREDAVTDGVPNLFSRLGALITWPFRLLLRGLVALFFLINDLAEQLFEGIGQFFSRTFVGDSFQGQRRARRFSRSVTSFLAAFVLLLFVIFELTPFYWTVITAFKKTSQIVAFESVFVPAPWTMEQFQLLLGPTQIHHLVLEYDSGLDCEHCALSDRCRHGRLWPDSFALAGRKPL
ncbi:MAG: hypothetical protein R3E79_20760 [Caldilineaceae bacterium]